MVSPKDFQHYFANVNGIRLHYVAEGSGPTVVLVHGWPDIWYGWRHQIKVIARAGYRVIAPDLRGFGQSDAPVGVENYGMKSVTGDLAALLDHLKIPQAVFIGHDWGGAVVWRMALFHPQRVKAVAGVCTPYTPRTNTFVPLEKVVERLPQFYYQVYFNSTQAEREFDEHTEQLYKAVHRTSDADDALSGALDQAATLWKDLRQGKGFLNNLNNIPRSKMLTEEDLNYYVIQHKQRGSLGGLNYYRNRKISWEQEANLPRRIDLPSLMVTAGKDPVLQPIMSQKMEEDMANLRRAHIENSGHFLPAERPSEFNAIIIDWLKTVAPVSHL